MNISLCSCGALSIFIFQPSDGIDESTGDTSIYVAVFAVSCGVKCDAYDAFIVYFVFGVILVLCWSYIVIDNSDVPP